MGFIAPFFSSFLDAAFVQLNEWGRGSYWEVWRIRLTSNILAALTIIPLIVTWATQGWRAIANDTARFLEVAGLFSGLLIVSFVVFYKVGPETDFALLMLSMPFLLWAALRFGSWGGATATAIVSFMAI
jgi:integral membrane sensor domain MASE1